MMRAAWLAVILGCAAALAAGAEPAPGAGTPRELVASVVQASRTAGFRLRATLARDGEATAEVLRVLVAGERDDRGQKLLIRALAPVTWHDQSVVVEAGAGAAMRAVRFGPGAGEAAQVIDVHAPVFDSGLVPWDLLGAWWRWPRHTRVRDEALLGHACVVVDSSGGRGPVARVRSWIAPALRLPLRLEFYGADGSLLRAMRVERVFRRTDGNGAARAMTLTDARGSAMRFDVYNGEDGIALAPDTFAVPGARRPADAAEGR